MAITNRLTDIEKKILAHEAWVDGDETGSRLVLSGRSLAKIQMPNRMLKSAKMMGCDLQEGNFTGTDLSFSDLFCSNLERTNFSEANLMRASMRGVKIRNANLRGANLTEADLRAGAIVRHVNEAAEEVRTDLSYSRLDDAVMPNVNLNGYTISPF